MDVWNLEQVAALARYGSFARAAEQLRISQPTLSKSVARLEDELRVQLFDRTPSGAVLTPIGALIADRADRILARTRQLAREAELAAGGETGTLRLGISPGWRTYFPADLVLRIADAFPRFQVEVLQSSREDLIARIAAHEIDIAVVGGGPDLAQNNLVVDPILRGQVRALAAPGHPLAQRPTVSARELAEFPCITAFGLIAGARAADVTEESDAAGRFYRTNDYHFLLPIALAGRATLVSSVPLVQDDVASGRLVILKLRRELAYTVVAASSPAARGSPIAQMIIDLARANASEISDRVGAHEAQVIET